MVRGSPATGPSRSPANVRRSPPAPAEPLEGEIQQPLLNVQSSGISFFRLHFDVAMSKICALARCSNVNRTFSRVFRRASACSDGSPVSWLSRCSSESRSFAEPGAEPVVQFLVADEVVLLDSVLEIAQKLGGRCPRRESCSRIEIRLECLTNASAVLRSIHYVWYVV